MLNEVNICGRLTADPELKQTDSGKAYLNFCVACDRNSKDSGADFINCTAWNGTAEFINKHFCKGKMIIVNGSIQSDSYTAQDGSKRRSTRVYARRVYFAGDMVRRADGGAQAARAEGFEEMPDDGDDVPF